MKHAWRVWIKTIHAHPQQGMFGMIQGYQLHYFLFFFNYWMLLKIELNNTKYFKKCLTVILQLAKFIALLALFLSQIEETLKVAEALLGDLSGFRNLRRDATELAEELQTWRQEQFDEWARDMQEQIDDPNQQLRYLIYWNDFRQDICWWPLW